MEGKNTEQEIISKLLAKNGKKGGKTTLIKYGVNHYSKIGKRGGATTKKLWLQKKESHRPSTNAASPKTK